MKIAELHIYPVKSLAGISLEQSKVFEKGLEDDRRWMIVDQNNQFITQRVYPQLALIKLEVDPNSLHLKFNGAAISVEKSYEGSSQNVAVWSDQVSAVESDPLAGEWLSDHLKTECKLVKMVESEVVRTKQDKSLSFADGYPYLVLGRSSMDDLNSRLDKELSILRFRPNIVFEGGEAFEEDHWSDFKIGSVPFRGVKPCSRCVLTTVDPVTAKKAAEPMRTLSTYRKVGNDVMFGLNAFVEQEGVIKVGDEVSINSRRN